MNGNSPVVTSSLRYLWQSIPRHRPDRVRSSSPSAICGSQTFRLAAIRLCDGPVGLACIRSRRLVLLLGMTRHIFLAVDRSDMRRIAIVIGAAHAKLLAVRIDPFPEDLAGRLPLSARVALDADDIGRKPV